MKLGAAGVKWVAEKTALLRTIDRLLRPCGIMLSSYIGDAGVVDRGIGVATGLSREKIFNSIFESNHWGSEETASGIGSEVQFTARYAAALIKYIETSGIGRVFDAPCGDLNWMLNVVIATGVEYIGGDVSDRVIELARQRCPDLDLRSFDICRDPFPAADIWHCRDCLFHLSFKDIWDALSNFADSNIGLALLTTHSSRLLRNHDIDTGGFRFLDLERAPFALSRPGVRLLDYNPVRDFPRFVGVWTRSQIQEAVRKRPKVAISK